MRASCLGWLLVLGLPTGALAQEAARPTPEAGLAVELEQLNTTLEGIRVLLAHSVETQRLELLLRRSDLASREVAEIDRELRSARGSRLAVADEETRVRTRFEQLDQLRERPTGGVAEVFGGRTDRELELIEAREANSLELQMLDRDLELIEAQAKSLDLEIAELEGRLSDKKRELRGWQDVLDRQLSQQWVAKP